MAIWRQLRHRSLSDRDRSRRFGSLSAKGTRWARLRRVGSAMQTTSCASRTTATYMHHLAASEHPFSSFRFPETKSAHLKFFPLSEHNP